MVESLEGFSVVYLRIRQFFNLLLSFRYPNLREYSLVHWIAFFLFLPILQSLRWVFKSAELLVKSMNSCGIGVTTEISEIEWVSKNQRYPAEPKYEGALRTYANKTFPFVTDIPILPTEHGMEAVGRLIEQNGQSVIEIAEIRPIP